MKRIIIFEHDIFIDIIDLPTEREAKEMHGWLTKVKSSKTYKLIM